MRPYRPIGMRVRDVDIRLLFYAVRIMMIRQGGKNALGLVGFPSADFLF